jgi:hypothetical protein
VEIPAGDVFVNQQGPGRLTYSFRCPACGDAAEKGCDAQVGRLLLLGGAQTNGATVSGLAAFRPEDVTTLRNVLDSPDWFDQLRKAS